MSTEPSASKYKVPNLERALTVLEYLLDHPSGLGATELTEALGYPRNSIYRITMTLWEKGYLDRDDDTKRFRLTRKLLSMGQRTVMEQPLIPTAIDIMRACRDQVKETILIGALVEDECVVLEQVLGLHPFKFAIDAGMRVQLHVSAPGKAILAYLPKAERKSLLGRITYQRYNERTITTKAALATELQGVRECGFSLDRGEQLKGIVCVGAPVFNTHGYPVAALWATGPSDRIEEDQLPNLGRIIRDHADQISERLGHSDSAVAQE